MSSKRDYVAVAKIVKDEVDKHDHPAYWGIDVHDGAMTAIDNIVTGLGDYFTESNPAFDRARFEAACGVSK